jgi:hypothetical protein
MSVTVRLVLLLAAFSLAFASCSGSKSGDNTRWRASSVHRLPKKHH